MLTRILLTILVLNALGGSLQGQERQRRLRPEGEEVSDRRTGDDLAARLRLSVPPELVLLERRPFDDWVKDWLEATRIRLAAEERALLRAPRNPELASELAAEAARPAPDTVEFLPAVPLREIRKGGDLPGAMGEYADLGMRVTGRGELGGQWNRYSPCDPALQLACNPSLFPQLKPDVLFGVAIGGTISERVHVNVDYDQAREFEAANNINVYYQGLQDEVLQRLEVGDVSIRLPQSRFLSTGIPTGNFGFMSSGQLGPMDFQAVFAQQKGDVATREFQLATGGQQGLVQDAELVLDDADYVKGQFFFLVAPHRLAGAPDVDVLQLRPQDAPDAFRPAAGGTIQLYRDERLSPSSGQQSAQLGYFLANATPPGGGPQHSGTFRRLIQEQDYLVHSSGLWVMLRSPLRIDEALAVSYVTESGDTIGTYDAERATAGVTPQLLLLRGPATTHQPGSATWPMELHQVYRLDSSSSVEPGSIQLTISLGEAAGGRTFRELPGQQVSFLRLFGLDEDAPVDKLDLGQLFQPGALAGDAGAQQAIGGTYVVFPTLQPFMAPPPVPSANLSAAQALDALGRDANRAIYEDVDPVRRAASTRFRLTFRHRVAVEGLVSSFNLGAFGLREASERIRLGERELQRDVDYTIDYDIGQVQLLDAPTLFAANPGAQLRATWEQKPLFQIAPTSVFGLNTRFRLGELGELNFVSLYQAEKSLMTRPQLGTEPGSIFLGGASARLDLGGALVARALDALPGLDLQGATNVRFSGELALSSPNPNTRNAAYVDDFESNDQIDIAPRKQQWQLGSRPQSAQGDRGVLPPLLDAASAGRLVWQHDFPGPNGEIGGPLWPQRQIDRTINVVGREIPESALWLTFGAPPAPGQPAPEPLQWRSMTQVLSTTGADLSRSEYLEFYVSTSFNAGALALVFDIGVVGEDAFYVDSLGRTSGTYPDGDRWGTGLLDEEAKLAQREVWGTGPGQPDERGLWDQPCKGSPIVPFALGDPATNCTKSNGVRDSEDLNGNGVLEADDGQYFRYVVQLDAASEYLVRDLDQTGTNYRLYRVPLRGEGAVPVNGATEASWRFVRHLRMTVAGEPGGAARLLTLARMRIVGSRWTKRDVTGVVRGMLDGESGAGAPGTQVRVGPVSQLTDGVKYQMPPGIGNRVQDPQAAIGATGVEFNEKSLRIGYEALEPGDRAEAFYHYTQQPRSFLTYRQMRLWAVARAGEWGRPDGERLFVKLGTDAKNYYLFQTRLKPATGDRTVTDADWLPEVVIDFAPWLALRAAAEQLIAARGEKAAGQDTLWSADSAYALVYENRARAPNLAAIRELSFAVYNGGTGATTGEVWLNDLRLGSAERQAGTAGALAMNVTAGDFLTGGISYARQDDVFRQLNQDPTYVGTGDLTVNADARLDKFLPASWGIELPLNVWHSASGQTPRFLEQSDVSADRLDGLRATGSGATRVGVRMRKTTPTANPLLSALVDGTILRVGYSEAHASAITSKNESSGFDADLTYRRDLGAQTVGVVPGFVGAALRALAPEVLEKSPAFQSLLASRLRLTPDAIGFGLGYGDQSNRTFRYDRILAVDGDSVIPPQQSPRRGLQNDATLSLQPFSDLDATFTLTSQRDLLAAAQATQGAAARAALERARGGLAGMDLGWETNRSLLSAFSYRPEIASWLRFAWTYDNRFGTGRDPSYLEYEVDAAGDTLAQLQRRFETERRTTSRVQFRPADFLSAWLGAPAEAKGVGGVLRRQLARLQPIELNWNNSLGSMFERELLMPGLSYQFGLGNVDRLRFIGADTAARLQQRDDFRASTSVAVVGPVTLGFSYRDNATLTFDARGGRRTTAERAWPGGSVAVRSFAIGKWLPSASASIGIERVERTSLIGGTSAQERGSRTLDLSPRTSLTFGVGRTPLTLTYNGKVTVGESFEPTGRAEDVMGSHNLMLTGFVQVPESLRGRFKDPLSLTLSVSQNAQRKCRVLASTLAESCVGFADFDTRSASFKLETTISELRVGSQLDYSSRHSYVGMRNGSNQFQLMLFGEFNFSAGQLPANFGGIR